jgi:hypothetical protein
MTHSPVKGPKGTIEFLGLLRLGDGGTDTHIDTGEAVEQAHEALYSSDAARSEYNG